MLVPAKTQPPWRSLLNGFQDAHMVRLKFKLESVGLGFCITWARGVLGAYPMERCSFGQNPRALANEPLESIDGSPDWS